MEISSSKEQVNKYKAEDILKIVYNVEICKIFTKWYMFESKAETKHEDEMDRMGEQNREEGVTDGGNGGVNR
jgi:hypothetical protein